MVRLYVTGFIPAAKNNYEIWPNSNVSKFKKVFKNHRPYGKRSKIFEFLPACYTKYYIHNQCLLLIKLLAYIRHQFLQCYSEYWTQKRTQRREHPFYNIRCPCCDAERAINIWTSYNINNNKINMVLAIGEN